MMLHAAFFVRSMDIALAFYCDKLGFSVADDASLDSSVAQRLSGGAYSALRLVLLRVSKTGAMIELAEFQGASNEVASAPTRTYRGWVTILVPDLKAHIDRMTACGLVPMTETLQVHLPKSGSCRIVCYEDPDSNILEFLEQLRACR